MKQTIRNNVFETNSSSTHALAIYKENKLKRIKPEDLYENSSIMENADGFHTSAKDVLSFIYTVSLLRHKWRIVDKLKELFPNCIFQKPQWELPDGEINFCDDREITGWCDLYGPEFYAKWEDEDFEYIYDHLEKAVCNSEVYVRWDGWYENDIVIDKYINKTGDHNQDHILAKQWIEDNIEILFEAS